MRITHGVEMFVIESMRSFVLQWEYWGRGRKKEKNGHWTIVDPKRVVTNAFPGMSLHHYGLAFDSGFEGGDPYLEKIPKAEAAFLWKEYGRFVQLHGCQWGGDWNSNGKVDRDDWDRPHGQLKYSLSIQEIQSLYGYGGIKGVWTKIDQIRGL